MRASRCLLWVILGGCILLNAAMQSSTTQPSREAAAGVLDQFHAAAAKADGATYFALFAPDAVFLGTDAKERWTLEEFKAFAKPYFDQGNGWMYIPRKDARHLSFSADGAIAWFDELLDNAKYGECRGTGILKLIGGQWRIAQYCLTIPIPNEIASDVVAMIRKHDQPGKASN